MPAALDAAAVPDELPVMLDDDAAMILFPRLFAVLRPAPASVAVTSRRQPQQECYGPNEGPESQRNQKVWTRTEQRLSACRHLQLRGPHSQALSTWPLANDRQSSNLTEKKE